MEHKKYHILRKLIILILGSDRNLCEKTNFFFRGSTTFNLLTFVFLFFPSKWSSLRNCARKNKLLFSWYYGHSGNCARKLILFFSKTNQSHKKVYPDITIQQKKIRGYKKISNSEKKSLLWYWGAIEICARNKLLCSW